MNIAMVDDRAEDLDRIRDALKEYAAARGTNLEFYPFSSGGEFLKAFRPFLYTVIFLDVYMDELSGIETAEKIRGQDDTVLLVFLTDSNERQADAIHWNVYDYVLKSDCPEGVWKVMDRILRVTALRGADNRISFTTDRRTVTLSCEEVVSVQANRNYLLIRDRTGTSYRTRMTFSSLGKQLLEDRQFIELTRGVIVNLNYVAAFTENACVLKDGIQLAVAARKQKQLAQVWRNFLFFQTRNSI